MILELMIVYVMYIDGWMDVGHVRLPGSRRHGKKGTGDNEYG